MLLWRKPALKGIVIAILVNIGVLTAYPRAGRTQTREPIPIMGLQRDATIETELLSAMHSADQIEITVGDLARSRGTIGEIRNFGVLLVRDHSDADRRIQNLAKQEHIRLIEWPANGPEGQRHIEMLKQAPAELESIDGAKFDSAFIESTDRIHRMLLQILQRGTQQLKPSPVKTLISKEIPILEQHEFLCGWCRYHCLNRKLD
jgi:putative membrane protein